MRLVASTGAMGGETLVPRGDRSGPVVYAPPAKRLRARTARASFGRTHLQEDIMLRFRYLTVAVALTAAAPLRAQSHAAMDHSTMMMSAGDTLMPALAGQDAYAA